jgi:hypothetical protein
VNIAVLARAEAGRAGEVSAVIAGCKSEMEKDREREQEKRSNGTVKEMVEMTNAISEEHVMGITLPAFTPTEGSTFLTLCARALDSRSPRSILDDTTAD